jgi:hypothetical protein
MERTQKHIYTNILYTNAHFFLPRHQFMCLCVAHPVFLSDTKPHPTKCAVQSFAHSTQVLYVDPGINFCILPNTTTTILVIIIIIIIKANKSNMPSVNTTSGKGRGPSFSEQEVSSMLDLIEERCPIGSQEWDVIEAIHNVRFPDMKRTKDTIKRKYSLLYSAKSPTGDPNCPPNVRRAKRIYHMIKEKTDLVADDDDDDDEDSIESIRDVGGDANGGDANGRDDNVSELNNSTTASIRHETPRIGQIVGAGTTRDTTFTAPMSRTGSKRSAASQSDSLTDRMDSYFNWMMMQRQFDRQELRERREEERLDEERRREQERREDRKRREEERQRREEERERQERQYNLMQMMLFGNVSRSHQMNNSSPLNSPIANPSNQFHITSTYSPTNRMPVNRTDGMNNSDTPTHTNTTNITPTNTIADISENIEKTSTNKNISE